MVFFQVLFSIKEKYNNWSINMKALLGVNDILNII